MSIYLTGIFQIVIKTDIIDDFLCNSSIWTKNIDFHSFIAEPTHYPFTPLESPAIHGGDDMNKTSIPHRKSGGKAPSFLTGFAALTIKFTRCFGRDSFRNFG